MSVSLMPLSCSVCFWCCLITLDLFWKIRLELKKFWAPLEQRGTTCERGENIKIVAYLNFILFYFSELRF